VFDYCDRDHNGYLSFEEARYALKMIGTAEEDMEKMLSRLDVNKDHRISKSEFKVAYQLLRGHDSDHGRHHHHRHHHQDNGHHQHHHEKSGGGGEFEDRRKAVRAGTGWKSCSSLERPKLSDEKADLSMDDILRDIEIRQQVRASGRFEQLDRDRVHAASRSKAKEDKPGKTSTRKARLHSLEGIDATFDQFDKDGNGMLDPNEIVLALKGLGVPAEGIRHALNTVDANGDGLVSRGEFHRLVDMFDRNGRYRG